MQPHFPEPMPSMAAVSFRRKDGSGLMPASVPGLIHPVIPAMAPPAWLGAAGTAVVKLKPGRSTPG